MQGIASSCAGLAVPGYYANKRALDRLGNVLAPELAQKGIFAAGAVIGGALLRDGPLVPRGTPASAPADAPTAQSNPA